MYPSHSEQTKICSRNICNIREVYHSGKTSISFNTLLFYDSPRSYCYATVHGHSLPPDFPFFPIFPILILIGSGRSNISFTCSTLPIIHGIFLLSPHHLQELNPPFFLWGGGSVNPAFSSWLQRLHELEQHGYQCMYT
jgi:hypothetical protein